MLMPHMNTGAVQADRLWLGVGKPLTTLFHPVLVEALGTEGLTVVDVSFTHLIHYFKCWALYIFRRWA